MNTFVIDSHTAGEPTRVVVCGGPNLGGGSLAERREAFRRDHDDFRSALISEPRGFDAMVGALLCQPVDASCRAGVIFFNNVGYLGMCGHGSIGVLTTLAHLGRIEPGEHRLETPVGAVTAWLHDDGSVTVENVPAFRTTADATIDVPGVGPVIGDVAWGGNWFFLIDLARQSFDTHLLELGSNNIKRLTEFALAVRSTLIASGVTGPDGQEIDHIELFGPAVRDDAHSRNFVLCPGGAYDRSPCGTGLSAKLACLFADGKLQENQIWRQESIIGSTFDGYVTLHDGKIFPHVKGKAYITAESTLILDPGDIFKFGIRAR